MPDFRSAGADRGSLDLEAGLLVLETLKRRRQGVYRAVPVPPSVLDTVDLVHGIREAHQTKDGGRGRRLWLVQF